MKEKNKKIIQRADELINSEIKQRSVLEKDVNTLKIDLNTYKLKKRHYKQKFAKAEEELIKYK